MLTNFNMIKGCFGDEEDPNSPEKFEIKNKRERRISYNADQASSSKVRLNSKRTKKLNGYNSENNKIKDDDIHKSKSPKQRKFSLEDNLNLAAKLENISETNKEYDIEYDYGNREYKLKLCDLKDERIEELVTQMKFRLEEGGGECFYEIGVEDNGNPLGLSIEELEQSVENVKLITTKLNASANILKIHRGKVGLIAEVMIKINEEIQKDKVEIKIGLLGEEGSGKSTLIGVLVSNKLDNGKGLARFNVFRHKHEILCGKTSSISHQILGFDENGELTNYGSLEKPSWSQIVNKSAKIINFYDMGGSKIFKKTITAFSPNYLDYFFLAISAENGITETTKDLINFANNMNLPIVTIFTKTDLVPFERTKQLVKEYKAILSDLDKFPIKIKSIDDIVLICRNIRETNFVPIFKVSNVKWEGLNLLKSFLSMLPVYMTELENIDTESLEFDIHETLSVGEKVIVTGIVNKGKINSESICYLGPDSEGNFKSIEIVNIQCKKVFVRYAYKGQYCSLYIKSSDKPLVKEDIRKGMVVLDIKIKPKSARLFEADLWTIDGSTKLVNFRYQPVLNIKHIRQGCRIRNPNTLNLGYDEAGLHNSKENLEINSMAKTKILFEFMFYPEYISLGSHVIINDQRIKAFGIITKLFH